MRSRKEQGQDMTREELREHCQRQIRHCEVFANERGVEPSGNIYEEHKLILELLEQEPVFDKIRAEIDDATEIHSDGEFYIKNIDVKRIIGKYKAESGDK